jgi:aryl-alcohol dehydrogenase-like predicted oxidoreductase
MDHVDIFHLHAVRPQAYDHVVAHILPDLLRQKEAGKIRHIGITESSPNDPEQGTMARVVEDERWEVAMFAFHMLNQRARRVVFPKARERSLGTLLMFVVRNIFSVPGLLARTVAGLAAEGKLPAEMAQKAEPLDFLVRPGGAESVIDAAYRFGRHEPGADVVLFGTGSRAHLRANIASILRPPLPKADVERLYEFFGQLQGVGLDLPERVQKQPA